MKKSLLALAVLGAFAGAASAQTNVTIYGVADAGFVRFDDGADAVIKLDSGIQSGSRIGFRGTEDLGGGLSAIFTLENGFAIDDGTMAGGLLFGRQAFVGLNGGFGSVKLGRQYNPIRNAIEAVDPFNLGLAGRADVMFNVYGDRADNTVNYTTPNMNGFTGQAAYSFGEIAGSTSTKRQIGLSVSYAAGPLTVILAHHDQNLATAAGVDSGDSKSTYLGGMYDFGVVKLHAAYAVNKGESAVGATTIDRDEALIGVSAPVAGGRILASYMHRSEDFVSNGDTDVLAIGYTYDLSKRTNLYTSYARIKNDANVKLGSAVANGEDPSRINVGVRHRF